MNLNEQLRQAYEAGRRQALSEQSQGQSDFQDYSQLQFEYDVQTYTQFFTWLLQNNFITNQEFLELIDYIAAGGTIKDLVNAGFLDTENGIQWMWDYWRGVRPNLGHPDYGTNQGSQIPAYLVPGSGKGEFYQDPRFPGLRVPKPPGYVPTDGPAPISVVEAYEDGRRQALNEQSSDQDTSYVQFITWLLSQGYITNETYLVLFEQIGNGNFGLLYKYLDNFYQDFIEEPAGPPVPPAPDEDDLDLPISPMLPYQVPDWWNAEPVPIPNPR